MSNKKHSIAYIVFIEVMQMENIRFLLTDLPLSVKAYTICKDDFYTVVINARLSRDQQQESCQHELNHIKNEDFSKQCKVGVLEMFAHK